MLWYSCRMFGPVPRRTHQYTVLKLHEIRQNQPAAHAAVLQFAGPPRALAVPSPLCPESLGSTCAVVTTLTNNTRDFRAGIRMHSHPKEEEYVYLTHVWLYTSVLREKRTYSPSETTPLNRLRWVTVRVQLDCTSVLNGTYVMTPCFNKKFNSCKLQGIYSLQYFLTRILSQQ